ncbi:MAG TPA: deoxyribonuclease V [Polyangiaceae bacterium LLY-WYZ-15_(1-7)]|nr:endonuclease V [Myxococcales bacterium]MBJ69953.1 endonuclease V [Sandaracinus sp.]HJL04717.1 deoxyribonuclease V [Polyangiaceae bacterium LLY-WYZ-15_(1-7)]HJL09718.1 deoxyribonuclease V [Polyangiaceae bacterium LLY-WYZ-15_(1-7)]HJL20973.1 deoxyribonuclease V [Polyangiaceae bacterium LLY-WYZ-15_(1-7)]
MQPREPFEVPADAEAARAAQRALAPRIELVDRLGPVRRVAGADVAYEKDGERFWAAVVVLDARSHRVLEVRRHAGANPFPYVPGCLSFRELPALLPCFAALSAPVDLVVCDGNGLLHPRGFGVASHLGLLLDVPSIGVAKNRLLGAHAPLDAARGAHAPITHQGRHLGDALRTRAKVKPVYVSPGHRVGFATARATVLDLARRYRLPETTRAADQEVGRMRREALGP